jgi:DNA-binding beta-propeller fold protein YncE
MVAASDYQSSEVGLLALDGVAQFYQGGATLGSDPALATSAGRRFWIDRGGGDILELDPKCATVVHGPFTTSDPGLAGSTDPQDVAVDPTTGHLWIARFLVSTVLVKSADGSADLDRIDLSTVTGTTRNPYMSSIRIVNGEAYVALEMLDYPRSVGPSYMARIDVLTHKVDAVLQLQGRNPFGLMVEANGALYLAEPGNFDSADETDAGVEKVEISDPTKAPTSTMILRESDVGASVDEIAIGPGCAAAIVADATVENTTSLIAFDPVKGTLTTPLSQRLLYTSSGFELAGISWLTNGMLAVGDRTPVAGSGFAVHVLEASAACALTSDPLPLFAPQRPVAITPVL